MIYEKVLMAIFLPSVILIIAILGLWVYLHERKYHPKIKSKNEVVEEPKAEFLQAKALRKRLHIYYASQLNIPRSVTEYYITFLLLYI